MKELFESSYISMMSDMNAELRKEIERLNNIIKDTKEVLLTTNNIEKALNVLDRIKELENGRSDE